MIGDSIGGKSKKRSDKKGHFVAQNRSLIVPVNKSYKIDDHGLHVLHAA